MISAPPQAANTAPSEPSRHGDVHCLSF